ncbi:alpha-L-fucosidase [Paenibacillus cymbidii]|uniref:alpha-L-fucosidase n=1 Tax=Paenibacillus cymbidii TaxID=1639034 RepID=UPI0014368AC6|nr:alpha-L-fucosidase [Paenibacillus cymbidii]
MKQNESEAKLAWWREARFGLFVHWGLYAVPAGVWDGEPQPSVGEWIMKRARIPVKEYERLAERFNPVRFDAQEWVNLAREAGMKYIVITAKHHDGFAMFRSASSGFNIADATPFGRDPLRELADACATAGIKLCFYYSQYQDWHHPDAAGNDWDYPDEAGKRFDRYMEEKALPQMRELMTGYGPIGLIWYDTPMAITADQSRQFAAAVRELQPDCLLNSRVGHGYHDYVSTGDNQVPADVFDVDWEVPATMNHTWGYKERDTQWKPAAELIRLLIDVNRKGGNFLLNVGPRADGTIPEASADILREIGRWLRTNGEAIYGTAPCPTFPYKLQWGEMTYRPGKLYLHFFTWRPGGIVLFGLQNRVKRAYLLADPDREVNVQQFPSDATQKLNRMRIDLPPEAPDPAVSVVVLEFEGELGVDKVQALLG